MNAPRSRRRFAGLAVIPAAIIGYFVFKLAIGFLVAGVASSTLGAFFGGPASRLPSDTQTTLEHRINAAVGTSLDGLSDADKQARILLLIKGGLPRLDAAKLLQRVQLESAAVNAVDEASCASFARAGTTGKVDQDVNAKVIAALDTTSFGAWIEINVEAIEAQSAGAPAARTIAQADSDAMYKALFALMSPTDISALTALGSGTEETDSVACTAVRSLYANGIKLGPVDAANFALADASTSQ